LDPQFVGWNVPNFPPLEPIWINTSKNISEQGSSTMPNVSKKEKQSKRSMPSSGITSPFF
jgi:hypothetical protein